MMRTPLLCCLAWSLVAACGAEEADELAGEGDDGESSKADGTGAFTYFEVAPDPSPGDGTGFIVSRPNRSTVKCGTASDAETRASCYARSISWSGSGFAAAVASSYEARLRSGEPILLRGQLEPEAAATRDQRVSALATAKLTGTFSSELAASQPMVASGDGPDCLYAQLNVSSVTVTQAAITVSASAISGTLDGVVITGTANFALACIQGSASISIRIDRAALDGETAVLTNLTIAGDGGMPQSIIQMLALREGGAAGVVVNTARALTQPIIDVEASSLSLAATEVWTPDDAATADSDLDNVFVLAKTVATKVSEQRLNSVRSATVDSIDFAASGASEAVVGAAQAALAGGGVIVAGPRFSTDGSVGRHAERFWIRATAE
ncbi:MAG: hypothetical protein WKG01_00220 [Kofleriaceae bacterium]